MWNCGECQMEFYTKTQKDLHGRTHQKKFIVCGKTYETVNGVFNCSVVNCSKTYKTIDGKM